jgi:hypothetical protein
MATQRPTSTRSLPKTEGSKTKAAEKSVPLDLQREIQTACRDIVIVRIGGDAMTRTAPSDQQAKFLLRKLGKALSRPGVSRTAVFGTGNSANRVYAYSVDPEDPMMIIREDVHGNRTHGKVVGGTFKRVRTMRG